MQLQCSCVGAVAVDGGPGFGHFEIRLCRGHVTSAQQKYACILGWVAPTSCRSGVWLCAFALMSLTSFAIHELFCVEVAWLRQAGRVRSQSPGRSHRFLLLRLPRLIEARASRVRALPDELLR
uniref:Uncharacterized protein n=1 Tax=Ananas comosus var. bracteatus TaxID=296719 RepID=A0A6V7NF81_ANACO|nr:unnamed protein product [Ananas comosus var. bracteatus]